MSVSQMSYSTVTWIVKLFQTFGSVCLCLSLSVSLSLSLSLSLCVRACVCVRARARARACVQTVAPYWTLTSLRLTTIFEIKKYEYIIFLPGVKVHGLGLKFCRLHRITDFCPLVCGLIEIIGYKCVSIILLHNIKIISVFQTIGSS